MTTNQGSAATNGKAENASDNGPGYWPSCNNIVMSEIKTRENATRFCLVTVQ